MTKRASGFTLAEIAVTIAIMSVAAMALAAPLLAASGALGARGPASHIQLSALAREQADLAIKELSGLSDAQWAQTLPALVAASPAQGGADVTLDAERYHAVRSYTCVARDLATLDPTCVSGFARVTVTVTGLSGGNTFSISFIKSQLGV